MTRDDRGWALVLSIMALALLAAFGLSLSMLAGTDHSASASGLAAQTALQAADAALEIAQHELAGMADWSVVAAGLAESAFSTGSPAAQPLPDGKTADLVAATGTLPEPGWRLFLYARARDIGGLPSDACVAVWVRPDPVEAGALALRADAFTARNTRRSVKATLSRAGLQTWKEVR